MPTAVLCTPRLHKGALAIELASGRPEYNAISLPQPPPPGQQTLPTCHSEFGDTFDRMIDRLSTVEIPIGARSWSSLVTPTTTVFRSQSKPALSHP